MMKDYQKPEIELIKFVAEEDMMLGDIDGEMGNSGLPEGWG